MCEYRKATEPDLYKVKASTLQVDDHLQEIKLLANRVLQSKMRFQEPELENEVGPTAIRINDASKSKTFAGACKIKGLVDAVQDAGKLLRDFDDTVARLGNDFNDKVLGSAYPNHLRDYAPIFKIDP